MAEQTLFDAQEIWKDVPGYEGMYQASTLGRVRSFKSGEWKVLKGCASTFYIVYSLHRPGNRDLRHAHKIILPTFAGPCPPGMVARHLNGQYHDNRLCNLAWGTRKQNTQDSKDHGTFSPPPKAFGADNHKTKLNPEKVRQLREAYRRGENMVPWAKKFGVNRHNALKAAKRESWKYVA